MECIIGSFLVYVLLLLFYNHISLSAGIGDNVMANIFGVNCLTAQTQQLKFIIESKLAKLRQDGLKANGGIKRDRIEIIAEILLFCHQYKAKTNIMYKTNMNYSQLQNHLGYLTALGMLTNEERRYVTTDKGYHFLGLFAELQDLMSNQKV